jgi:hypothetical protein
MRRTSLFAISGILFSALLSFAQAGGGSASSIGGSAGSGGAAGSMSRPGAGTMSDPASPLLDDSDDSSMRREEMSPDGSMDDDSGTEPTGRLEDNGTNDERAGEEDSSLSRDRSTERSGVPGSMGSRGWPLHR